MDCHHLMYKPLVSSNPYEKFIQKEKTKQTTQKKQLFYRQLLRFKSSRYPPELIQQLQNQISPFEHSLDSMKQIISKKHGEYPEDVIEESVEYVYNKKSREATMIKESMTIIEEGDQFVRNGRRLRKEDFSYSFDKSKAEDQNQLISSPRRRNQSIGSDISFSGSISKRENLNTSFKTPVMKKDILSAEGKSEIVSPTKFNESFGKNQLFNEMIADELRKQRLRHKNIQLIFENDVDDILVKEQLMKKNIGFTDRSVKSGLNTSFPYFKEKDVIVPADGGPQTGRSEMQQLNFLLSQVSIIGDDKKQGKGNTSRRSRSTYNVRINKQNMENLYNAQGNLKIDVIKRAVQRMKRNQSIEIK